jgi:hypothetical protein
LSRRLSLRCPKKEKLVLPLQPPKKEKVWWDLELEF